MTGKPHRPPPPSDPRDPREPREEPIRGGDEGGPRGPSPFAPTPEDAPRDRSGRPRVDEPEPESNDEHQVRDPAHERPELE
jgi:hypothetical protein